MHARIFIFIFLFIFSSLHAANISIKFTEKKDHFSYIISPKKDVIVYKDKIRIVSEDKTIKPYTNYKGSTFTKPVEFTSPKIYSSKLSVLSQACSKTGICFAPEKIEIKQASMLILISALIFGIIASFSPCYLPLLPMLASQINAQHNRLNGYFFITGVLLANLAIGISIQSMNIKLTVFFNSYIVQSIFACILIYITMVILGLATIPTKVSNSPRTLTPATIAAMGFTSVFILSPCTTAPLAAAINLAVESHMFKTIMLIFGIGSTTSLLLFLYGFRFINSRSWYEFSQIALAIALVYFATKIISNIFNLAIIYQAMIVGLFTITVSHTKLSNTKQKVAIISLTTFALGFLINQSQPKLNMYDYKLNNNTLYFITANWCSTCSDIKKNLLTKNNVSNIKAVSKFAIFDVSDAKKLKQLQKYNVYGPPAWVKINEPKSYVRYGKISLKSILTIARM